MVGDLVNKVFDWCSSVAHLVSAKHSSGTSPRAVRSAFAQVHVPCFYATCERLDDEQFFLSDGEGALLAVGTGGMVILVGEDLAAERILEVRTWDASVGLTVSLLEVCWSRKAVSQEEKDRYVVEGKFLFRPYVVSEKRVVSVAELTSEAIEKDRGNPGIEREVDR